MERAYSKATPSDGEPLADILVAAMRPSLEAVGRFDPARARVGFSNGLIPKLRIKSRRPVLQSLRVSALVGLAGGLA
ncbi:MAG: hypothetical protein ABGW81_10840 [Paracoccaceae bacterium]